MSGGAEGGFPRRVVCFVVHPSRARAAYSEAMLGGLEDVDWDAQDQPAWNAREEVADALRELATATQATGDARCSRLLYAVGNNHCGTYFPVVLSVVPFLQRILIDGGSVARCRTLDVLIDLRESFVPDPDFEVVETALGPRPLIELLRDEIAKLVTTVNPIAAGADSEEATLARDLLDAMRDSGLPGG